MRTEEASGLREWMRPGLLAEMVRDSYSVREAREASSLSWKPGSGVGRREGRVKSGSVRSLGEHGRGGTKAVRGWVTVRQEQLLFDSVWHNVKLGS